MWDRIPCTSEIISRRLFDAVNSSGFCCLSGFLLNFFLKCKLKTVSINYTILSHALYE